MQEDMGASQATGLAGAKAPEPPSRLGPTGSIPCAISDPMERQIAAALEAAGIAFIHDSQGNPSGLDFALSNGVEIEVKQFHADRIAEQMARAPNVIAIQGREAVRFFAALLHRAGMTRDSDTHRQAET